jgi:hypothetical protein
MYRAYVLRLWFSTRHLGWALQSRLSKLRTNSTAFVDLARPGGVSLRNVETDILKGFFTKLKKAFLLPGSVCDAAQSLRLRELCRASLQPTQ